MGKLTRSGFLVAAAAALVTATNVLVGCGANTDENTPYRGGYTGMIFVQSRSAATSAIYDPQLTGTVSVTLNHKGDMIGNVVNLFGDTYALDGDADENDHFEATLSRGGATYRMEGYLSAQPVQLPEMDAVAAAAGLDPTTRQENPSPSPSPSPSASAAPEDKFKPGLGGDFEITVDGQKLRGSLGLQGGVTVSQGGGAAGGGAAGGGGATGQ